MLNEFVKNICRHKKKFALLHHHSHACTTKKKPNRSICCFLPSCLKPHQGSGNHMAGGIIVIITSTIFTILIIITITFTIIIIIFIVMIITIILILMSRFPDPVMQISVSHLNTCLKFHQRLGHRGIMSSWSWSWSSAQ